MSDLNSGISKASDMITGVARALVGLLLALIVLFVLAGIVFPNELSTVATVVDGKDVAAINRTIPNVINGLILLVKQFLTGGFAGLLALILFVGFLTHGRD